MSRKWFCIILVAIALLSAMGAVWAGDFPIATEPDPAWYANISGDNVIWIGEPVDSYWLSTLNYYNLATQQNIVLTTWLSPEMASISDRYIVWGEESFVQGRDICAYDMLTGEKLIICTGAWYKTAPVVAGSKVAWKDDRNGASAIYLYDIATGIETQISAPEAQCYTDPVMSDTLVAWTDTRNGNFDIYAYNLITGQEFPVCTAEGTQAIPLISGNYIIWTDVRSEPGTDWFCCYLINTGCDIYGYDVTTGEEFPICTAPGSQGSMVIYGNIAVWTQDHIGENLFIGQDLWGYDLTARRAFPICTAPGYRSVPLLWNGSSGSIPSDIVLWSEPRDFALTDRSDQIYGYDPVSGQEFCIDSEAYASGRIIAASDDTIIWQDWRNDDGSWPQNTDIYGIAKPAIPTQTLVIGAMQAAPGMTGTVPVVLQNGAGTTSVQFDLRYDAGSEPALLALQSITLGAGVPADWVLESQQLSPGIVRVHAYSPSLTPLTGNAVVANIRLAIAADATIGQQFTFWMRNVTVLGAEGEAVLTGDKPGNFEVVPKVDHFAVTITPVAPEPLGVDPIAPLSFNVHIEAQDTANQVMPSYNGTAQVSCAAVTPSITGATFTDGVFEGTITLAGGLAQDNVVLQVADSSMEAIGASAPFSVRVKSDVNGDGITTVQDMLLALDLVHGKPLPTFPREAYLQWAADLDNNGIIDMLDVQTIVRQHLSHSMAKH
jgi:TolB protein